MYKIKFVCLILFFLGVSVNSYANRIDWVRACIKKYPEILWLADENVRKTEENSSNMQGCYSEQLFGKKFIEFDRTMMTLHCLELLLDGDDYAYEAFTKVQTGNSKLSRKSFDILHEQGVFLLNAKCLGMTPQEMRACMEASLVLGDIGKSEKARNAFRPYGLSAPDHDDFHEELLAFLQLHPELCPTFERLTSAGKKLLSETANLGHYGHMTHIEGGPSMYTKLKMSRISSEFLLFDFFVHTCDVAGALGHVNNQSSIVYTEYTHLAMQGVFQSCRILDTQTEMDAYDAYLLMRAKLLELDASNRTDRALTRMGTMLRLFTSKEGAILKEAIQKLPEKVRRQIIEQLDIQKEEELRRTPTYIPAVLVNLANNPKLGSTKEERLNKAVILGLPFIARVLETHKQQLTNNEADSSVPLNFNGAAKVAKMDPFSLENNFSIDSEGNICISKF